MTHTRRGQAPYVLLLSIVAALLAAAPALAAPAPSISAKQAEVRQVLTQVNALNASLNRADELVNLANLKLAQVQRDITVNKHELAVARRNLARSRKTIAQRLVTLYTSGSSSTLEVILGARSVGEMIDRIDTENRVSSLDLQVANQVAVFKTSVQRHRRQLAAERSSVRKLVAERRTQRRVIETRLGERRALLSSLDNQVRRLIAEQQARELRAARAAQRRAADAQAQQAQAFAGAVVGTTTTTQTPAVAAVLPPSSHSGVVGDALRYLGVPYVWAGASPAGFDCSGFVMYAYGQVGISLPHSSYAMWADGVPVPRDQLQPGDLVFFDGLGHVGIYVGGGEFVHAPHSGTVVSISSLDSGSYAASYVGARRIL